MAGLLDTIIAKRASQDALARQAANEAALSSTPDEQPSFADVTQAPTGISQADSALANQSTGSRQFEAGVYDVKGGIKNAMAAAAQALGGDPLSLRKSALEDQRAAERVADPNSVSDIRDIDGPTKLGSFVFGQAARGAPMIGAMGVGAGLGAAAGAPALAGAGAASLALNTGETYGQTHEAIDKMVAAGQITPEKEQELRGNALRDSSIAGALNAALDTGSFGILFKANPIAKSAMAKVLAPSLMGHVGRSLLAEGGTEALQEYISIAAQKHALEKPEMFGLTSEEAWQLANAGAAGASMAAPFAPVGHFGKRINDGVDTALTAAGGVARKVADGATAVRENPAVQSAIEAGTQMASDAVGAVKGAVSAAAPVVQGAVQDAAPIVQSTAGAVANTVKGVAGEVPDAAVRMKERAVELYGEVKPELQAIVESGRKLYEDAKPHVAALAGEAKIRAVAAAKAAYRALADAAKPAEVAGAKKSLAGALSEGAKRLRDDLMERSPQVARNDATLLAKRLDQAVAHSAEHFDAYINHPEVAKQVAETLGLSPPEFKHLVLRALDGGDEAQETSNKLETQGTLYDAQGTQLKGYDTADSLSADEAQEVSDWEQMAQDDGSLADIMQEVDNPSAAVSVDNPHMDPPTFNEMIARSGNGVGRWVNITRTTTNAAGEVVDTKTEPYKVDFVRVAKAWQKHTAANGRKSEQANMDGNFKEGIAALLNGWSETDGENHVAVQVEPANAHHDENGVNAPVSRGDLKGWLKGESVVGRGDRTFKDVEKAGRANKPVTVDQAVQQFYDTVAKDSSAQNKLRAADNVAREVVATIRDSFDPANGSGITPEGKQLRVERMGMFLANPAVFGDTSAAIKAGVHPAMATLPSDIRALANSSLVARLGDLEQGFQGGLKSEQETSVDNPDRAVEGEGPVTQDLAGDHINYAETQKAGEGAPRSADFVGPSDGSFVRNAQSQLNSNPGAELEQYEGPAPADVGPLPDGSVKQGTATGVAAPVGPTKAPKPSDTPYKESPRAAPAKQENALDFDRETATPGQHSNPKNDPSYQLMGKRQRPDVKGKVNEKPREQEPKPPGEREALAALKRIYVRTESAPGKALIEQAMNRVKSGHVLPEGLAKLAAEGLKPSDIKAILAQKWSRAQRGESAAKKA